MKPSTSLKTSETSNPIRDLAFSRSMTAKMLKEGEIAAAACFASASAKLILPATRWGLLNHYLLTAPAVARVAEQLVQAITDEIQHVQGYEQIVDEICREIDQQ